MEEEIVGDAEHIGNGAARRRRRRILAVLVGVIVVLLLIVVTTGSKSSGGNPNHIVDVNEVNSSLAGVPQNGVVLGSATAPATIEEYGDLQCPICRIFAEEQLNPVIEKLIKTGQAKMVFKNFPVLGPQSLSAGVAALAAAKQGRYWQFIELFYKNQGEEKTGYITPQFLYAIAKHSGIPNLGLWEEESKNPAGFAAVGKSNNEAKANGFTGTPSFLVVGPKGKRVDLNEQNEGALARAVQEVNYPVAAQSER